MLFFLNIFRDKYSTFQLCTILCPFACGGLYVENFVSIPCVNEVISSVIVVIVMDNDTIGLVCVGNGH